MKDSSFSLCPLSSSWVKPLLSDIEFDIDGSMILGFTDIFGHKSGDPNYSLNASDYNLYSANSSGDIQRAYNNNGVFELEQNGTAGPITTAGKDQGYGYGYEQGLGEFYFGDTGLNEDNTGTTIVAMEATQGGLALLPGNGQVLSTGMDIFSGISGGIFWLNNTTGDWDSRYYLH